MPVSRRLLLGFLVVFAACDDDPAGPSTDDAITLDRSSVVVAPGDSVQLVATMDGDGEITWASTNENVATVTQDGVVHAVGFGTARIVAFSGNHSARADVLVEFAATAGLELGAWHSCRVRSDGSAQCWGADLDGQLGLGSHAALDCYDTPCADEPAGVGGGRVFAQIAPGDMHTCGMTTQGEAYCWGSNWDHLLGVPPTDTCHYGSPCNQAPTRVAEDVVFRSLTSGAGYTCGIALDRSAWCWGANWSGTLGHGGEDPFSVAPVQVAGGHTFIALSAGTNHVCGVDTQRNAWCWGSRSAGQLGDGAQSVEALPQYEPVQVSGLSGVAAISAGDSHTCAVTTANAAFCWGSDVYDQLGTDDVDECPGFFGTFPCSALPVEVAGGHAFRAIAAGGVHSCAVATDGAAWCWGSNQASQLGTGDWLTEREPLPVAVSGHQSYAAITAGSGHTCAVTSDTRDTWCWGDNFWGQLGIGGFEAMPVPTAVQP